MKRFALLMGLSALAMVLPWSIAAYERRWALAVTLFVAWLVGYACAAFLWFGVGVGVIVLLGLGVPMLTWVDAASHDSRR